MIHPSSFNLHPSGIAVVKVGGSLYDLPDLGPRLRRWLTEHFPHMPILVVPGGGPLVEEIRRLDGRHKLGEENSHWLALRALSVNAHFLAALLPPTAVCGDVDTGPQVASKNRLSILDVHEFARQDEQRPGRLPHSWAVTSDGLAARVAIVAQACQLVLLKSTTVPLGMDWMEAGRQGLVDSCFAEVLREAPDELRVRAVNLREWSG